MDIRTKEAVRYLGYGRHAIDEQTLDLVESCFQELEQEANVKFVYRIFEIIEENENELTLGGIKIQSKNLCNNLKDCKRAIIFCATLGTSVDALIKKYSVADMAKAVVLQACAAAFLEEYCDNVQKQIAEELEKGLYLRPRFSPGYGDFSLLHQKELLQMTDASKQIALAMTDGYMLTPSKSITAVIGISSEAKDCTVKGCTMCTKEDCIYKRS